MEQLVIRVNVDRNKEGFSHEQWLERGRRWWKTKPSRAIEAENLFVIDAENFVVAVGRIAGVLKDLQNGTGRVALEVIPDPSNEWIGSQIKRGESRNPVSYVDNIQRAKS